MPKISVVLPVYNGEKFLKKAIESVIDQTYSDWELIIVDDCSVDSSPQIMNEYVKKDVRIRVIHNETNQKLPRSLNVGFEAACGDYYTWTSDDNVYLPQAFEKMLKYLDQNTDEVMVSAALKYIDSNDDVVSDKFLYDDRYIYYQNVVGACFLYRKKVFDEIGLYNPEMFLVEDYDYWIRILIKYGHIGKLDEVLYYYRTHVNSLTELYIERVKTQLFRLRKQYLIIFVERLKEKPEYQMRLFLEYLFGEKYYDKEDLLLYYELCPILRKIKKISNQGHYIAYGAGVYGDRAFQEFGDKIEFYADKHADKIKIKNGKPVILPEEIPDYSYGRNILLSVSVDKMWEIILMLDDMGIENIYVSNLI